VWDANGFASGWSTADFCVVGFERPRLAEIVSPPPGQSEPDPAAPATHIVITPGMAALPKVKAGARVRMVIDSVGPLNTISAAFPYGARTANKSGVGQLNAFGSRTNRWTVEFWTEADLDVCPSGTIVGMKWEGTSASGNPKLETPAYAAGAVQTEGTVLNDWVVILKGKD